MTEKNKFLSKIIYLVIIIVLLPLLFYVGRPAVPRKTDTGETEYTGGILALELIKAELNDREIGKVDPTSSTLQLATFGMRGIAMAVLWHQLQEQQKKHDWNNLIATSNQIMTLEPHFVPVWEFLGWNLAYNASQDVDDYRERYAWAIRGFEFLTKGTEYNKNSAILFQKAGWTISQKIGIADENEQYRKLFREDDAFHELYHTPSLAERDNWLFGIQWYKNAERLFEAGKSIGNMTRLLFYSHSRMNVIHYAEWYEKDGKFDEKAKECWHNAEIAWRDFADLTVVTTVPDRRNPGKMRVSSLGLAVKNSQRQAEITKEIASMLEIPLKDMVIERWTGKRDSETDEQIGGLNDLEKAAMIEILVSSHSDKDENIQIIRTYLNETMPDWQTKLMAARDAIVTDPEQQRVRAIPLVVRNQEEKDLAQKSEREIAQAALSATAKLRVPLQEQVLSVRKEDFGKAEDLLQEYDKLEYDRKLSEMFRDILNYPHHEKQIVLEQMNEAVDARRYRHEGRKRYFEGNIGDADRLYLDAMGKWKELIERERPVYDYVADMKFRTQFLELAEKYKVIRDKPEFDGFYPENFPLEFIIIVECEDQHRTRQLEEAYVFTQKVFEEGNYDDALRYVSRLVSEWHGVLLAKEYLNGVPVPQYRDDILDVVALYVQSLKKTEKPFDPKFTLTKFVNHVIKRDPLVETALEKTGEVWLRWSPSGDNASEQLLDQAVSAWKPVLEKFPILTVAEDQLVDPDIGLNSANLVIYRNEMKRLAALYKQYAASTGEQIPADFALAGFLP